MDRKLHLARLAAAKKGIRGRIEISPLKNKRFMIIRQDGKIIHFGLYPFLGHGTFLDHGDESIREAWRARHGKIKRQGKLAYLDMDSPEYYSWNILW